MLSTKKQLLLVLIPALLFSAKSFAQRNFKNQGLPGRPYEVVVTPYKTTMLANGKDEALITIAVIDKQGNPVSSDNMISISIKGSADVVSVNGAKIEKIDTAWIFKLVNGKSNVIIRTGREKGIVKFEAKSDSLYTGSTEIHTIQPGKPHVVTTETYKPKTIKDKILGADISFLPQLEDRGMKFSDNGVQKDAIEILKDNGFNYIRLRIFNQPELEKGYSPQKGFCDLAHTKQMAKRIKAAGLKFLLDFHYSDYWADPQQQNKPAAWAGKDFTGLKTAVYNYTKQVMQELKAQGTVPDMVQVGNEINHGMIWPEGHVNNLDSLAQLFYAGAKAVKEVNPATTIMLHVALGGQAQESEFFLDNMLARKVPFDIIGLSYYPKWHGTLDDLRKNIAGLAKKYNRQVMVAEYSQRKTEVNDIAFTVPGGKGVGSFIWEPLNTWEAVFDRSGKSNEYLKVYPGIAKKYLPPAK